MSNHGNFIVSLGSVCRWLATKAEALGVEIYPGFAAAEVLFDDNGAVAGVATGDMGIGKNGSPRTVHARHGAARQIHAVRGRRARQSRQAADREIRSREARASRRNSASASRSSGRSRPTSTARGWCSIRSAGRSTARPAAARFSITSTTIWCRSASSCISIMQIRICRRSRNSSASRRIRWCAIRSPAASVSLMARAP